MEDKHFFTVYDNRTDTIVCVGTYAEIEDYVDRSSYPSFILPAV